MVNILHDGNYLFYKSLYVYPRADKGRMLDSKSDRDSFMKKCMTDFAFVTRKFKNLNKVIVTIDDYSWRKHVEIEENSGYKGNRVKDESATNWDAFNEIMTAFGDILQKRGVIVTKPGGAEGDDSLYLWSERLLEEGQNSVIITGDGDLAQTVRLQNGNFVVVYDPRSTSKKLSVPVGFEEWTNTDNEISLMDASSFMLNPKSDIDSLIRESKINVVKPEMVVYYKIITGDGGDGVPSIWTWKQTQNLKDGGTKEINKKITDKNAARIFEILTEIHGEGNVDIYNLQKYSKEITKQIVLLTKQNPPEEKIHERLLRNTKLVWLDESVMPPYVIDNFNTHHKKYRYSGPPEITKYDMPSLLEGTEYYSGPDSYEADIFSNTRKFNKGKSLF